MIFDKYIVLDYIIQDGADWIQLHATCSAFSLFICFRIRYQICGALCRLS